MKLHPLSFILHPSQIVTDPVQLLTYEVDAGLDRGRPDGVVFPRSAEEVAQVVRWAAAHGVPLIARGAGTGLAGGAVAEHGGLILQLSALNRIELDPAGRIATAEAGAVNLVLDGLARAEGLYFPPDPSSQRSSTIGGNIGTNAGGPHCFKYGVTTNYVAGVTVVLADGRLARFGGPAHDYPEYDLTGLITGGEGTLGVVTKAYLRLVRNPPAVKTLMAAFDSVEAAGTAVSAIIAGGLVPATMEMMDEKIVRIIEDYAHPGLPSGAGAVLIVEVDGHPASVGPQIAEVEGILRAHGARELRVAGTAAERDQIWYARKSAAGAMARLAPAYYLVDGTVPRSRLAETLAAVNRILVEHELRAGHVFHAGDGNLHPLILVDDPSDRELIARVQAAGRAILEVCVAAGGSITGEHGVGIEKRAFMPLMYSPAELDVMREIKAIFDPQGILNPGKVIPPISDDSLKIEDDAVQRNEGMSQSLTFNLQSSILTPSTPGEATELLHESIAQGRTVRIAGGGTKSALLPLADMTLSTAGLRGVRAYAPADLYVTVGAGTPLAELQAELSRDRMWAPLASPWPAATVGGIVAAALNAPLRMRYGGVRDVLLAATVALPDGRTIRAGRPVVKNVAGYDLPKLFAGSHGTLGLLTDLTLKIAPLPRARATLVALPEDLDRATALAARLLRTALVASALLIVRPTAGGEGPVAPDRAWWRDLRAGSLPTIFDTSSLALIYTAEGHQEDVADELAEARAALREAGVAGVQLDEPAGSEVWGIFLAGAGPHETVLRAGVPPQNLPALLAAAEPALAGAPFVADVAAGLLYARGAPDVSAIQTAARERGGYAAVLSAPPGYAGDRWGHVPDGIELMRALKRRWDPHSRLNPGAFIV
ncbi:MAG TPA: FAD-linked oxidase C-terminal domain-containing protein [Roseiflexaceae bacterium]|nr:FAD-linked oxidase C-terminal domain-containing protein [Roseiflexaceae bacterium]